MVRYLPDFGYEPVVVTAPGPGEERWTPSDATLNSDVPPGTVVRRIDGPEPPASVGWRHRAERWLRVKDAWSRSWIASSTRLGIEAARETDVDLVYAWTQPYVSAEAVAEIARAVGKPWVADLGDPWALDEMMIYPTGLHRRLELRQMRRVLASASALVMSTPEAVRRVRVALPEFADRTVVAIPNGFEAREFSRRPAAARSDDVFRIVHTGYLHTDLGLRQRRTAPLRRILGGAVPGVDILGRSHVYLIEAVERVRREHPEIGARLEVQFAGVMSPDDIAIAQKSPASRLLGFVSHDDALQLLERADLLFLPMHHLPAGTRATVVPGKTYEYIASGRPILAAVPEGDARDLLDATGTAYLCDPKDVDAIATAIVTAFRRWRAGHETAPPPPSLLRDYDYRSLACALASVFDQVTAGSQLRRSAAA
jgi:glycosyltransferase involved in cell wall biosynthesis